MNRVRACALLATFCLAPTLASAQSFGFGIFNAATRVVSNATGRLLNSESPVDIAAERERFYANFEQATSGMTPDNKASMRATFEKQWDTTESQLLFGNAQIAERKKAGIFDAKSIVSDIAGSTALGNTLNRQVFGDSSLTTLMQSAALDGVVKGFDGAPAQPQPQLPAGVPAMGNVHSMLNPTAGLVNAAAQPATSAVGSRIGNAIGNVFGTSKGSVLDESVTPTTFFDKPVAELSKKVVSREASMVGWKKIQQSADGKVEIYAPVIPQARFKAAAFTYDDTGAVIAAFRILKGTLTEFQKYADDAGKLLGTAPSYAGSNGVFRAMWRDGTFLTVDATTMSFGWSVSARGNFETLVAGTNQAAGH